MSSRPVKHRSEPAALNKLRATARPCILDRMKWIPRELGNAVFIILGILAAGMGLHGFLLSSGFIDGGVTGISMLLAQTLRIPLPILIVVINLPFVALGYRQVGRTFAIKSAVGIFGLAICLATVHFPDVTSDKLLDRRLRRLLLGRRHGPRHARRRRPRRHRHRGALDQ